MARTRTLERARQTVNIALFDSSTLLGKGVKKHLLARRFPRGEVQLFDTGTIEEGGNISEFGGEARLAVRPDLDEMDRVDLAFFCGEAGSGENYLDWPGRGRFVAIDLTGAANGRPGVPVVNASVNLKAVHNHQGVLASPQPVAQFLSSFLNELGGRLPVAEVVCLVMQPASEAGERGIEELYRQTVGLLNCKEVPKDLFGRVLAFNLVPLSLSPLGAASEESVASEILAITGTPRLPLALRIFLAPVFHCHAFAARVRFWEEVSRDRVRDALSGASSLRVREEADGATPAELAGEEKIVLGEIRPDLSTPKALWFWGIADNLATGSALNAVRVAEQLLTSESLRRRA